MSEDKLKVVAMMQGSMPEQPSPQNTPSRKREQLDNALRAEFERRWLRDPQQFDPTRTVLEQDRLARCWAMIEPLLHKQGLRIADLGCGWGVLAKQMQKAGAQVDAVDISNNALKRIDEEGSEGVRLLRATLPFTPLEDHSYDVVVCTDVIAELHGHDRRLLVSELNRLVKKDGIIICSTALDTTTDDALGLFLSLMQTECALLECKLSHHGLWLRLRNFLEHPEYYLRAKTERSFFRNELDKRGWIGKKWFQLQMSAPFQWWWRLRKRLSGHLLNKLHTNLHCLDRLESFCRQWRPDTTRSHVISLARRRGLEEDARVVPEDSRQSRLDKCIWT